MDDAVRCENVGVDEADDLIERGSLGLHRNDGSKGGRKRRCGQHIFRKEAATDHMIEKNVAKRVGVGEQRVERPLGKRSEGLIGGGKHGEGAVAHQRVRQSGRFESGRESRQTVVAGCDFGDGSYGKGIVTHRFGVGAVATSDQGERHEE